MHWPSLAVERVRPSRFRPPFCPWRECPAHRDRRRVKFHRHGSYLRPSDRCRIPRYRCLTCRGTCSRQTFSFTYYLKRRDLPTKIAAALQACSAHRQIARSHGCAKTTVTRLADRLARHALLLQSRALANLDPVREKLVHDHFETFVGRQDRALGIGTTVGAASWFMFDVDPAPHPGSGRRPDRKISPRPHHAERLPYAQSIGRTLDLLAPLAPEDSRLTLVMDGRNDYRTALNKHPNQDKFWLEIHPNPKRGPKGSPRSAEAMVRDAAMFPMDQLHQLMRHTCADHKRETIAFGRRLESIVGRVFLTAVWRNFVKGRSERKPDRTTSAMQLGLADRRWSWTRVLSQRLFPTRETTPESWRRIYGRTWTTGPVHSAKHAY